MSREDLIQSIIENLGKIQRPGLTNRWKEFGLSHAQVGMLHLLFHHDHCSVKEAADFLGISKSAVTQLLDPLEAKGLLRRSNDIKDRRIVRLDLTDKGKKALKELMKHKLDAIREAIGRLSDDEIKSLHEISQKMTNK